MGRYQEMQRQLQASREHALVLRRELQVGFAGTSRTLILLLGLCPVLF